MSSFSHEIHLIYLNCSNEWDFLGFQRTSDIQFFWRWNILAYIPPRRGDIYFWYYNISPPSCFRITGHVTWLSPHLEINAVETLVPISARLKFYKMADSWRHLYNILLPKYYLNKKNQIEYVAFKGSLEAPGRYWKGEIVVFCLFWFIETTDNFIIIPWKRS